MKRITILIPCYHKHINLLFRTLESIVSGTMMPYQILISLNGCRYIPSVAIERLESVFSKYVEHFDIIKTTHVLNRAAARNVGYEYIKGDIISLCDADDIQHYQRTEIISYFFNKYDISHLLHSYILNSCLNKSKGHCFLCEIGKNNKMINYDIEKIGYCDAETVYKLNYYDEKILPDVKTVIGINNNKQILTGHGICHFTRDVFSAIKFNTDYPRGQDSLFCQEVLKKFKNTMVIDAELTIYYNGWVPQSEQFDKFRYNGGDLYLNLGSKTPPPPGKPRPEYEYKFIQDALDDLSK